MSTAKPKRTGKTAAPQPAPKRKPGRPPSDNPKDVTVSARLDSDTARRLDAMCAKFGAERSDVLRWMVRDTLAKPWIPSQFREDVK